MRETDPATVLVAAVGALEDTWVRLLLAALVR